MPEISAVLLWMHKRCILPTENSVWLLFLAFPIPRSSKNPLSFPCNPPARSHSLGLSVSFYEAEMWRQLENAHTQYVYTSASGPSPVQPSETKVWAPIHKVCSTSSAVSRTNTLLASLKVCFPRPRSIGKFSALNYECNSCWIFGCENCSWSEL